MVNQYTFSRRGCIYYYRFIVLLRCHSEWQPSIYDRRFMRKNVLMFNFIWCFQQIVVPLRGKEENTMGNHSTNSAGSASMQYTEKGNVLYRFEHLTQEQLNTYRVDVYGYLMWFTTGSGLNEARPVIRTCIAILMNIAEKDTHSSFGFIGANLEGETHNETKRFRVYRRILTSYFSQNVFEHYQIVQQSAYAMVRKSELATKPNLIEQISMYFSDNYTNFD